jgi:hypothetical protein
MKRSLTPAPFHYMIFKYEKIVPNISTIVKMPTTPAAVKTIRSVIFCDFGSGFSHPHASQTFESYGVSPPQLLQLIFSMVEPLFFTGLGH